MDENGREAGAGEVGSVCDRGVGVQKWKLVRMKEGEKHKERRVSRRVCRLMGLHTPYSSTIRDGTQLCSYND